MNSLPFIWPDAVLQLESLKLLLYPNLHIAMDFCSVGGNYASVFLLQIWMVI